MFFINLATNCGLAKYFSGVGENAISSTHVNLHENFCYLTSNSKHNISGKTIIQNECIIRGDLANVRFGRQCVIGKFHIVDGRILILALF